jgi:hypothetical protein
MSADKGVMMRDFHLYIHADGTLWKQLVKNNKPQAEAGITAI